MFILLLLILCLKNKFIYKCVFAKKFEHRMHNYRVIKPKGSKKIYLQVTFYRLDRQREEKYERRKM